MLFLGPALAQDRCALRDSITQVLQHTPQDTLRVNLLNKLAGYWFQSNADSMVARAREAKTLAQKLHFTKGTADAIIQIAIYNRNKGDYAIALEELHTAAGFYEQLGNTINEAEVILNIAQVYKDMSGPNETEEYLDKALDYSRQSYSLYNSVHDTAGMANSLSSQGITYRDKGKVFGQLHYYDSAFKVFTAAISLVESSGKGVQFTGKLYNNISQVYLEYKKDYHRALDYLFKAVAFNTQRQNQLSLSFNYGNISHAYVELHDLKQALLYANKMKELGMQLKRPERLRNAYSQLYEVYKEKGRMDSALHYYVLSDQIDDSLNNVAKTGEVVHLQTKYETARKESQIQTLQTESDHQTRRIAYLIAGIVLSAALVISLLLMYNRVRKQRQQIALQAQHKEMMMKELHHRVKNNLQIVSSLLSLQTYKVQDEGTVSVLRESQQRVQAMSFIHQRLYKNEDLTAVNMKEYLTDLAESLVTSYGYNRDDFDLQILIDQELIDVDKALPIGLVINEMITNSLKYAYHDIAHPSLHISLTENAENMVFVVKDNGIGIDEKQWNQQGKSFGKQLITALCKQMRAKQTMTVADGTQFTIIIPKQVA